MAGRIKVLAVLKTFSKQERRSFRSYVKSLQMPNSAILVKLLSELEARSELKQDRFDKTLIWKTILPKKTYNDLTLRRLFSKLNELAQQFLINQALDEEPIVRLSYWLNEMTHRKLEVHFTTSYRQAQKLQKESTTLGSAHYYQAYLLEKAYHNSLTEGSERSKKVNIEATDQNLDYFFLAEKLKHYCDALNYNNVLDMDISIGLIEPILAIIPNSAYLDIPVIAIYYNIVLTLKEPNEELHFQQLVQLLEKHSDDFKQAEILNMYIFAQNYCIKKINSGNGQYYKELLDIYKFLLERSILFVDGLLVPWDFKNMVTLGLHLKEFDWTAYFIENYCQYLPKAYQKTALSYNLASLHFHKKEHNKVIELLKEVEYQDVVYAVGSKWLLLRTYYEIEALDALDALLESFRIYILRSKVLSKDKQKQYLKLIKFTRKLTYLNLNDKKAIQRLKQQIEDTPAVANKAWLLEKIQELIN